MFDRTLKKVLMTVNADLYGLPVDEFDSYLRNDNMLDHLTERVSQLELSLAETRDLKRKLNEIRGRHNNMKGHYYEHVILLRLIRAITDGEGGLVSGISVTDFRPSVAYHLETGEEIDVVVEGEHAVIAAECKNYDPENIDKITADMVDRFIGKAGRLRRERFPDKELRLAFFSKHGFESKLESYLEEKGIVTELGD